MYYGDDSECEWPQFWGHTYEPACRMLNVFSEKDMSYAVSNTLSIFVFQLSYKEYFFVFVEHAFDFDWTTASGD